MKRTFLALLAALLIAGCGAGATPAPAVKLAIPWGAGDSAAYTIMMDGKDIGTLSFSTQGKDGGYVITTETAVGAVKDVSNVRVDQNLRPIGNTRQISGAGKADFTLMAVYDKGKLSIQAKTADGDKAATINAPADSWDNDQSLVSIRALPLADGFIHTYTNIVGASASALKTTLTVRGREKLEVPAGSFTTYKVEMDFGAASNVAWYDVNTPHHLVQYENTPLKQTIVLTKVGTP